MAQSAVHRKQVYQMYKSMGYTAKQAANMRNRGVKTLISDYRAYRMDYNKEFDKPPEKRTMTKPYRPEIVAKATQLEDFISITETHQVPVHIVEQMIEDTNAFDIDIYEKRIEGFRQNFEGHDLIWSEVMLKYDEIFDLGEWLDFLGELYDELNPKGA